MSAPMHDLFDDLARLAASQPDKVALTDAAGLALTYGALVERIQRVQAWLSAQKLAAGAPLVVLLPNSIETIVVFLAALRGGHTYAPLPCTATPAEIDRLRRLTGARHCLVSPAVSATFRDQIAAMDWRVLDEPPQDLPAAPAGLKTASGGRLVLASSGSTGEPKAIVIDANRLWSAGHAFLRFHGVAARDLKFWNYLPMSYLGGLFNLALIPLAAGGTVFVDEAFSGKTFLVFWTTVERFKINTLWLVPTILRGLVSLAGRVGQSAPRPSIAHCFLGTAPVSLAEKQAFAQLFGIQPLENFALSETTFLTSESANALALREEGTVGAVMPGIDLRLVPATDDDAEGASEIHVRTPYQMLGYLHPDGTIDPGLDADGYFATGDYGEMAGSQLRLTGRRRDIIKKGGLLVLLREIELVVETHPGVAEAAAVRIEHDFYGESYELHVRPAGPATDAPGVAASVESWLHEQLVRHKWPERVVLRDDFPRTPSGKVRKHLLRGQA